MSFINNDLKKILKIGESESVELKKSFDNEAIITLSAFANTKGGSLIVGVDDNGNIAGIDIGKETLQSWMNEIKQKTNPSIIPDVEEKTLRGKRCVVFSIKEYPVKPVSFKGRYYRRIKNSNHLMLTDEVVNLHLKTFNMSWDYYIDNDHSLKQIALDKVAGFVRSANQNNYRKIADDPITALKKYELIRDGRISKACFLLFMKEDSLFSTIELGRFQSATIIKDAATVKTDLISEVGLVMEFIKKHLNKEYVITGRARREERWTYPLEALREIVLNMIVHRDYARSSDSIIKIFDDRIEFYNPGRLLPGLTVKKLLRGDYASNIRNKQIAEIFKEMGLIEKYGSGIKRIIEAFRRYGLKRPSFKEVGEGFMVVAYSGVYKEKKAGEKVGERVGEKVGERVGEKVGERVGEKLSPNQLRIMGSIANDPAVSAEKLAGLVGISSRKIEENLRKLKKKGMLKRIGGARGGHWRIEKNWRRENEE